MYPPPRVPTLRSRFDDFGPKPHDSAILPFLEAWYKFLVMSCGHTAGANSSWARATEAYKAFHAKSHRLCLQMEKYVLG